MTVALTDVFAPSLNRSSAPEASEIEAFAVSLIAQAIGTQMAISLQSHSTWRWVQRPGPHNLRPLPEMTVGSILGSVIMTSGDIRQEPRTLAEFSNAATRMPNQDLLTLVEIPAGPDQRHEPVIKGKGVPVWVIVAYAKKRQRTPQEVTALWKGLITEQEVRAALAFEHANPEIVWQEQRDPLLDLGRE